MTEALLVALGAAMGAPTRYLLDRAVMRRAAGVFPWGTLLVNVLGSFLLGLVLAAAGPEVRLLVGVGFCGALTTFSTFGFETSRLLDGGARLLATANVLGSVLLCLASAGVGHLLGLRLAAG